MSPVVTQDPAKEARHSEFCLLNPEFFAMLAGMSNETGTQSYEDRAWQYFLQLQPTITDVNAAAELAFRAVDAFERQLKRKAERES